MANRLCLAVCVVALSAVGPSANRPQPLDLRRATGGGEWHPVIDKQSWWLDGTHTDPDHTVRNPLSGCTWDINENNEWQAFGYLAAGATAARTDCHVMDISPIYFCFTGNCYWSNGGPSNWLGLQVMTQSAGIVASLCVQPGNRCFTATPIYNAKAKLYTSNICIQGVYDNINDPAVVDILGSSGGRGVVSTITRSVTNTASRDVRSVWVNWGLASDVFSTFGCPSYPMRDPNGEPIWQIQSDYPWRWVGE